jgi:hypothetical protein
VIIGHRGRGTQSFFSGVVGLAVEFPLYGLGHPNNKPKKERKNHESTDSV